MNGSRELIRSYLRQRMELGERELYLDSHTAFDLKRLLSAAPPPSGVRPSPSPAPAAFTGTSTGTAGTGSAGLVAIGSLEALRLEASSCTRCGLARTRTQVVFGEGDPQAELLVVGEAPGADEDRSGRPFVGRAGKLLNVLLASAGFARERVFICNVLKCRPPGNRNPEPAEVESCQPYLARQVELVAPRVILACGSFAAQTLLQSTVPISRLRGTPHRYADVTLIATYHPAALLRNSGWVRSAWEDLQLLRRTLDSLAAR